jgi:hypothetical protein
MSLTPQAQKVLNDLQAGFSLTPSQAKAFYGVRNLCARVAELRQAGYCVYTNKRNGRTYYRLGSPTKRMIQTAYSKLGPDAFSE